jgi:hypothetical protein
MRGRRMGSAGTDEPLSWTQTLPDRTPKTGAAAPMEN